MSSDIMIAVENVGKCYFIYDRPNDRLKQALSARLAPLLRREIPKFFREFWAVKGVSFSVSRGETVGIIGRNGAGKSTLLQMICGTLTPTSGRIQTFGKVAALLELGSGFNPEFTGRENVLLNASILGLSDCETAERLPAILDFAGLGDFIDQPVKSYSSGMVVRLAFAVIAHVDADILVIDEALAVGDAFFVQKCMRFLHEFKTRGTLLFVSHDTGSVLSLCDRAIWVNAGEVALDSKPREVADAYFAKLYEAAGALRPDTQTAATWTGGDAEPSPDEGLAENNISEGATSFGTGGAEIVGINMLSERGKRLHAIEGGEKVVLSVVAKVYCDVNEPIIGFVVRNRLGQPLFGDNTFLTYKGTDQSTSAGTTLIARFEFNMPYLVKGDYTISAAIADGSQECHIVRHWVNDGISFKALSDDLHRGLIGIPIASTKMIRR